MSEILEVKKTLLNEVLTVYQNEYDSLKDNWKSLEAKAQAVIAISSVFIGGSIKLFYDIKNDSPMSSLIDKFVICDIYYKLLILSPIILLSFGILFAMWALRIRDVTVSPTGDNVESIINSLICIDDKTILSQYIIKAYGDRFKQWRVSNYDLRKSNGKKAMSVMISQWLFILSVFSAICISVYATKYYSKNITAGGVDNGIKMQSTRLP